MKVQMIFKWFDFWIGIFYDQKKNWIYIFPIPMVGIILKLPENWRIYSVIKIWRLPKLGNCLECKKRQATHDYNGHKYYVCKLCYDSLNRYFDEEYK